MNNQAKRCFPVCEANRQFPQGIDSYQIVSTLLSNIFFGKDCIVKDMGDYIEVDTIHTGKVAIGASKYLEGGWDKIYSHYMWQISDVFQATQSVAGGCPATIQEYKEVCRGPFSCNLYPSSEVSRMISDIEKEYIRREKYKYNII